MEDTREMTQIEFAQYVAEVTAHYLANRSIQHHARIVLMRCSKEYLITILQAISTDSLSEDMHKIDLVDALIAHKFSCAQAMNALQELGIDCTKLIIA